MDISCFLHACISKPKAVLITCYMPACVPTDLITLIESNHVSFLKHNICPYYVFYGRDHPMKVETKASRCDQRKKAKAELFSFYECGKDSTGVLTDKYFTIAMRNMKKITCRANELINLVKNWMIKKRHNTHMCSF